MARLHAVENIIERLVVYIAKHDVKVLAKRHIAVAVNDEAAHDTLTAESQMSISPLVVKNYEVEVFLRLMDAPRYFGNEIRCREQFSLLEGI